MQVDAAEARQSEHPGRDDAAVGDDDDGLGSDGLKLRAELGIAANFFRLGDGQSGGLRGQLDCGCGELLQAACGAVWLRDYQGDFVACFVQRLERRHGELGSAAEDQFHSSTTRPLAASCGSCAGSGRA